MPFLVKTDFSKQVGTKSGVLMSTGLACAHGFSLCSYRGTDSDQVNVINDDGH